MRRYSGHGIRELRALLGIKDGQTTMDHWTGLRRNRRVEAARRHNDLLAVVNGTFRSERVESYFRDFERGETTGRRLYGTTARAGVRGRVRCIVRTYHPYVRPHDRLVRR